MLPSFNDRNVWAKHKQNNKYKQNMINLVVFLMRTHFTWEGTSRYVYFVNCRTRIDDGWPAKHGIQSVVYILDIIILMLILYEKNWLHIDGWLFSGSKTKVPLLRIDEQNVWLMSWSPHFSPFPIPAEAQTNHFYHHSAHWSPALRARKLGRKKQTTSFTVCHRWLRRSSIIYRR